MENKRTLEQIRSEIDALDLELLELFNKRGQLVKEVGEQKDKLGLKYHDPKRERQVLDRLAENNKGPYSDTMLRHIFKILFKESIDLQVEKSKKVLLVSRKSQLEDTVVMVGDVPVGNGVQTIISGPCSVESLEQVREVAEVLKAKGLKFIRGGAFKPRTSPYDFQGLGLEGLKILRQVGDEFGLKVVSEIVTPADIELSLDYVDVIQIGARNMQNFELLKAAGRVNKPVLLKRGLSATIEEFVHAAEYIMSQGNPNIILCERGIRTYEKATRNTLDINAVPILRKETHLPVMVDVTHAAGRKDILIPSARAALAIGADAVMVEVHPNPPEALSDSQQQLNFREFDEFMEAVGPLMNQVVKTQN